MTARPVSIDKHYVHVQNVPATEWEVVHNLGKRPAVVIVDSAGTRVMGTVQYYSGNLLYVRFSTAFSGTVYCN
jgi:hypothetical protein